MSVFKTLSAIDCGSHIEKKGNLSYLSWTWAWGILMEHFPSSSFVFHDDAVLPDGSVMVSCTVTVECTGRTMWLPVMDHKNNAIKNPDSRKISDARMRCLVKAIALHGLGLYIYAGEDLPQAVKEQAAADEAKKEDDYEALVERCLDTLTVVRESLAVNDYGSAKSAWRELDEETMTALWKAPSKGGWFTTVERQQMRSPEWSAA